MAERQYHLKFDNKNAQAVDEYLEYKRQVNYIVYYTIDIGTAEYNHVQSCMNRENCMHSTGI